MPCITIPFDPKLGAIIQVGFTPPRGGELLPPGTSPTQTMALIDTGAFDRIDLGPLTRTRFADRARWVIEELHI